MKERHKKGVTRVTRFAIKKKKKLGRKRRMRERRPKLRQHLLCVTLPKGGKGSSKASAGSGDAREEGRVMAKVGKINRGTARLARRHELRLQTVEPGGRRAVKVMRGRGLDRWEADEEEVGPGIDGRELGEGKLI